MSPSQIRPALRAGALLAVAALALGSLAGCGPEPEDLETRAPQIAAEFMRALEDGDAAGALAMLPARPEQGGPAGRGEGRSGSPVLLPIGVYEAALENGAVGDVEIREPVLSGDAPGTAIVPVAYTVAERSGQLTVHVADRDGDGTFELDRVTAAELHYWRGPDLAALTLNGTAIGDVSDALLLPGVYQLGTDDERFAIGGDRTAITAIGQGPVGSRLKLVLSAHGRELVRDSIRASLDSCLAQSSVTTECTSDAGDLQAVGGTRVRGGDVERSLSAQAQADLETMSLTLAIDAPGHYVGEALAVRTRVECLRKGRRSMCEVERGDATWSPFVDLRDPELPVTWR